MELSWIGQNEFLLWLKDAASHVVDHLFHGYTRTRLPSCCCRCPQLPNISVYWGFMRISAVACRPSCLVVFQISRSAPHSLIPWQNRWLRPIPTSLFPCSILTGGGLQGKLLRVAALQRTTRFECDASELMLMLIIPELPSFPPMRWTPGRLAGRPPATRFPPRPHFFPGLFSPRPRGQNGGGSLCSLTAASLQRSRQTNSELAAICHGARGARVLLWSLLWYWKQQLSGRAAALTAQRPPGTTHAIWRTPWGDLKPRFRSSLMYKYTRTASSPKGRNDVWQFHFRLFCFFRRC